MNYLGDFAVDTTLYKLFNTFSSDDPSASMTITGLALGDIKVYKNGGTTERASTSGFVLLDTDGTDFDGITGIHGFSIDLSDNTDAGFYAAGNEYSVVISSVTLDAATINFVAAEFSIERSGGALALLKSGTYGLAQLVRSTTPANALDVNATGEAGLDLDNTSGTLDAAQIGADAITAAKIAPSAITKGDQLAGLNDIAATAVVSAGAITTSSGAVSAVTTVTNMAGTIQTLDALDTAQDTQHGLTRTDVSNLNNVSTAQVNAEVVDVLKTDTISDLSNGAPTDTPTFEEAVMYLYSALTNKVITKTSGTPDYLEFYNGAGTIIWRKQVSDDGSDYTELEAVSGS